MLCDSTGEDFGESTMNWLKKHNIFGSDTMMLTIMVWVCTLPLVGFFVAPFFGGKAALISAGVLFILALLLCWGICGWKVLKYNGSR